MVVGSKIAGDGALIFKVGCEVVALNFVSPSPFVHLATVSERVWLKRTLGRPKNFLQQTRRLSLLHYEQRKTITTRFKAFSEPRCPLFGVCGFHDNENRLLSEEYLLRSPGIGCGCPLAFSDGDERNFWPYISFA